MPDHDATASPHPDDRPRPPRRRDDRDRRRRWPGPSPTATASSSSPAPAASWARSSCPRWTRPDNHRRLGEIRAAELEAAMGVLGVTEWENLGYHDSDMMGRPGNRDPRTLLAGRPRRGDRPAGLARPALPPGRHDDLQRVRRLRAPRPHPDPRRRGPARSSGPATRPGTRSSSLPSTAGPARPRPMAASRPGRRRSSTSRRSRPRSARR